MFRILYQDWLSYMACARVGFVSSYLCETKMTFEPNCLGEKNKWFFFSFALVVLREMPGGLGFFNQDLWQNS